MENPCYTPAQIKVMHCYREANFCADAFARIGSLQDLNILYYNSPPPSILNIFLLDMYGHESIRLCPATDVFVSPS